MDNDVRTQKTAMNYFGQVKKVYKGMVKCVRLGKITENRRREGHRRHGLMKAIKVEYIRTKRVVHLHKYRHVLPCLSETFIVGAQ